MSRLVVKMGINDTDVIAVYNSMPINGNIAIQKKQLTDSKPGWLKKKGENVSIIAKRMIFV